MLVLLALLPALAAADFLSAASLSDGERLQLLSYNGLFLKRTSVQPNDSGSEGLSLVEASEGEGLLQLIYRGTELLDCDEARGRSRELTRFLRQFRDGSRAAPVRPPDSLLPYLSYPLLAAHCASLHRLYFAQLLSNSSLSEHRKRSRRGLSDMLRVPGTKWCGKGYSARKYHQVGNFAAADRCCRTHDLACPHYIPAMSERYGLFNWRVNTLMHCSCDRRFRSCLKMADTGAANLVGKLFFNMVQTKCFVLKAEKICTKSWWGKCHRYTYQKRAHVKPNKRY